MHQFIADTTTWQPDLSITEPKIRAESQKQRRPKHEGQTRNTEIRGITLMDSDCLSGHIHDYFVIAAAHGFLLCRLVPLQFGPLQTHEKKISKSENFFCQLSFKRMEEEKRRRRRKKGWKASLQIHGLGAKNLAGRRLLHFPLGCSLLYTELFQATSPS